MQNPFFEFYRANLRSAANAMSASLERSVRLQERQLDVVNAQVQGVALFWAGVWRAVGDAQLTMMAPIQEATAAEAPRMQDEEPEEGVQDPTELAAAQISRAVGQARRRASAGA